MLNTEQHREESSANVQMRKEIKCLKISLQNHQDHSESVQQCRHELNRTVIELKQGEKRIEELEQKVDRLESRCAHSKLPTASSTVMCPRGMTRPTAHYGPDTDNPRPTANLGPDMHGAPIIGVMGGKIGQ